MKWTLSERARLDLLVILSASHERFGQDVRRRYRLLLERAIQDVADDPRRAGVHRTGGNRDVRFYHSRHARLRTPPRHITRPRHIIVFEVRSEDVRILRVLHDAMDLPSSFQDL